MKVGITSNFTHIILYCILKVIGVASAHSLVPPSIRHSNHAVFLMPHDRNCGSLFHGKSSENIRELEYSQKHSGVDVY